MTLRLDPDTLPLGRVGALRVNSKHYVGVECSHGHGRLRYTSTRDCILCSRAKARMKYVRKPQPGACACSVCAEIFQPTRNGHITCRSCLLVRQRARRRVAYHAKPIEKKRRPGIWAHCHLCGSSFRKYGGQMFCSPEHQRVLSNKRATLKAATSRAALVALTELGIKL